MLMLIDLHCLSHFFMFCCSLTNLEPEVTMITLTWPRKQVLILTEYRRCSVIEKITCLIIC